MSHISKISGDQIKLYFESETPEEADSQPTKSVLVRVLRTFVGSLLTLPLSVNYDLAFLRCYAG